MTLKEIDKQKDEFASMISHELKTPLVPILGYVNMLKKTNFLGNLNDKQMKAVQEIERSSKTLERLIDDILTSQKLEMGKLSYDKKPTNVRFIINNIIDSFSPIADSLNVKIHADINCDSILFTDSQRLIQVISNLVKNSLDFVPKDVGAIEICAANKGEDVLFYVKDNGCGIPFEKQKNIFSKFYQADNSTRRRNGTGLGLVICKKIINDLGGNIWFESNPGSGTIFYFSIPKEKISASLKDV